MEINTLDKPFQSISISCDDSFANNNTIKEDMEHQGEKQFQCTICEKSFLCNSVLKNHMGIHTRENQFRCSICDKLFAGNTFINEHMGIHTGVKPFLCSFCDKSFTYNCDLQRHTVTQWREVIPMQTM